MAQFPVNGCDISQFQAATPPLSGMEFAFVKATEGNGFTDPRYHAHAADVKAAGKVLGAYHFGRSEVSGAAQAAYFLGVVGADTKLVALDIEGAHAPSDAQAREFIAACKAAGRTVGVYHSVSGFPTGLGQDFNWIADWRNQGPPEIPWAFWQTTSSGTVPGYPGRLDLDLYNGTLAALSRLAGLSTAGPIVPAAGWRLLIAAHAAVQVASVTKAGCISGPFTERKWGNRASGAPCSEPVQKVGCATRNPSTLVLVTAGTFRGKWVHLGPGVTAVPPAKEAP